MQDLVKIMSALSSDRRLQVMEWLKAPTEHFPEQVYGDLRKDGACSIAIAEKLGVSGPTCSRHLNLLVDAGLLKPTRIRQWTFYSRNEPNIKKAKALFSREL